MYSTYMDIKVILTYSFFWSFCEKPHQCLQIIQIINSELIISFQIKADIVHAFKQHFYVILPVYLLNRIRVYVKF